MQCALEVSHIKRTEDFIENVSPVHGKDNDDADDDATYTN